MSTDTLEAPVAVQSSEAIVGQALVLLAQIDLRTIKNAELRNKLKSARAELKDVRRELKQK